MGIDEVYQYLVPEQFRRQLKNVGIMGGISFDVGARVFLNSRLLTAHARFVVSSSIRHAGLFCSSLLYCRCHEKHSRQPGSDTRGLLPHLARVGRPLRWPTLATRAFLDRSRYKYPRTPRAINVKQPESKLKSPIFFSFFFRFFHFFLRVSFLSSKPAGDKPQVIKRT